MSYSWQDALVLLAIGWAAGRLLLSARGLWRGKQGGCPSCGSCDQRTVSGADAPSQAHAPSQFVSLAPLSPDKKKRAS